MRLWHKDLLYILPERQLIAQWRELSAIASNIKNKGTPNHILVNPIMDYDLDHFITYAFLVKGILEHRKHKVSNSVWERIVSLKPDYKLVDYKNLFNGWHTYRYFLQCYFNLEEKYDRGGIILGDYFRLARLYNHYFDDEFRNCYNKWIDTVYVKESKLC